MKILLEQVISGDTESRITIIDGSIDDEQDARMALDTIGAFDLMLVDAGYFNENDHIHLEINGDDIGYDQINDWTDLVAFLGGEVNE